MPRIGVSITKSTPFRNATQEFSNVYYYAVDGGAVTQADASAIIDNLTTKEKALHSTAVTFVRGRCWSQEGSPGANEMLDQHNLSGTGSASVVTSMDKERAYLFRIRAGNDSRGNPVYLRKWYHSCGNFGTSGGVVSSILDNTSGFSQATRDAQVALMDTVDDLSAGGRTGHLVSKSGRNTNTGAQWTAHQYLEHHQLGDMWRAQ